MIELPWAIRYKIKPALCHRHTSLYLPIIPLFLRERCDALVLDPITTLTKGVLCSWASCKIWHLRKALQYSTSTSANSQVHLPCTAGVQWASFHWHVEENGFNTRRDSRGHSKNCKAGKWGRRVFNYKKQDCSERQHCCTHTYRSLRHTVNVWRKPH